MHGIRNRITYANVMATIAVFLVLGGATAVAASKLGKNTVGTKQLKANSVTTAKLKRNAVTEAKLKTGAVTEQKVKDSAITTAKIKDGAVTGAKVQTATLGTVPSASTLSGYIRRGIVRVGRVRPSTVGTSKLLGQPPRGTTAFCRALHRLCEVLRRRSSDPERALHQDVRERIDPRQQWLSIRRPGLSQPGHPRDRT